MCQFLRWNRRVGPATADPPGAGRDTTTPLLASRSAPRRKIAVAYGPPPRRPVLQFTWSRNRGCSFIALRKLLLALIGQGRCPTMISPSIRRGTNASRSVRCSTLHHSLERQWWPSRNWPLLNNLAGPAGGKSRVNVPVWGRMGAWRRHVAGPGANKGSACRRILKIKTKRLLSFSVSLSLSLFLLYRRRRSEKLEAEAEE